jgi:hypothetical protein
MQGEFALNYNRKVICILAGSKNKNEKPASTNIESYFKDTGKIHEKNSVEKILHL